MKIRQVAEDLGVRYVLEGSMRRAGDRIRINAQLIDATTGGHLWAERYDRSMADVFAVQDEVVERIVLALAVKLTTAESNQASTETDEPEAYDTFLQGRDHYRRETPADYAKAISYYKRAIELDPGYSRAYAGLATVIWSTDDLGWGLEVGLDPGKHLSSSEYLARALEQPTAEAYALSSNMLLFAGRHDDALVEIDAAVALEPNRADSYVQKSWILTVSGRAEEAEKNVRLAMRLNPNYRAVYLRQLGRAQFYQGHYEEAAQTLGRAIARQPEYTYAYDLLAAAYGHIGSIDEATAVIERYNEIQLAAGNQSLTVQQKRRWHKNQYSFDDSYLSRLLEGLRKAGVPEGAQSQTAETDYETLVKKVSGTYIVKGAPKIVAETAKMLWDRGVVFVNALPAHKHRRGHIPNSVNLHLDTDLTEESLARFVGKDEEVVFYCSGEDCYLSPHACAKALTWGYTKVYYFAGGIPAWKAAGYRLETSE